MSVLSQVRDLKLFQALNVCLFSFAVVSGLELYSAIEE